MKNTITCVLDVSLENKQKLCRLKNTTKIHYKNCETRPTTQLLHFYKISEFEELFYSSIVMVYIVVQKQTIPKQNSHIRDHNKQQFQSYIYFPHNKVNNKFSTQMEKR